MAKRVTARRVARMLAAGFGVAAAVPCFASVAAAQTWSPEEQLFPSKKVAGPAVEVASDGYAIALWATVPRSRTRGEAGGAGPAKYSIRYAVRATPGSSFGPRTVLRSRPLRELEFGMGENGRAFVAWLDRRGSFFVARPGTRSPSPAPVRIARDVGRMHLSVAEDGTAILVYSRVNGVLLSRTATGGGDFGGVEEIVARKADPFSVEVDAGLSGRGVVGWIQRRSGATMVAERLPGGSFGRGRPVPELLNPDAIELAAAPQESILITEGVGGLFGIVVATAPAGERFSPPTRLTTSRGASGSFPRIDVDAGGNATAVWGRYVRGGNPDGVELTTRPAFGIFSAPLPLIDKRRNTAPRSFDVAADGGAVVTWNECLGPCVIKSALRPAGTEFLAPQRIGDIASPGALIETDVSIATGGGALAGWSGEDGGVFVSSALAQPPSP